MNDPRPVQRRKAINVSLDPKLVEEARSLGINVSRASEAGLIKAISVERGEVLRRELAPTIAYWNDYVEKHGLLLAKYRMF